MVRVLGKSWVKIGGQVIVLVALVMGLVAFVGNNKNVVLTVDGQASNVQTFGGTVGDVLAKANVEVSARDEVSPALDATVENGTTIEVIKAKEVTVTLDGSQSTVHTTGETVGDLVDQLGVEERSKLSASPATELTTLSNGLVISTPKAVKITVAGKTTARSTTALTVAQLLTEAGIKLGAQDRVSAQANARVVENLALKVTRVDSKRRVETESVPFKTVTVEDASLYTDQEKVTRAGVAGVLTRTYKVTTVDGRLAKRTLVSSTITRQPVAERVAVGTKDRPEPEPVAEAKAATTASVSGVWQSLAECESGGNWSINTGNGYYGGLQFSLNSWMGAGGGKYASRPDLASPAEQIATAEVLRSNGGWGHWPSCAAKLGLL